MTLTSTKSLPEASSKPKSAGMIEMTRNRAGEEEVKENPSRPRARKNVDLKQVTVDHDGDS